MLCPPLNAPNWKPHIHLRQYLQAHEHARRHMRDQPKRPGSPDCLGRRIADVSTGHTVDLLGTLMMGGVATLAAMTLPSQQAIPLQPEVSRPHVSTHSDSERNARQEEAYAETPDPEGFSAVPSARGQPRASRGARTQREEQDTNRLLQGRRQFIDQVLHAPLAAA
eukprot:550-Rhodomonas_salina.2